MKSLISPMQKSDTLPRILVVEDSAPALVLYQMMLKDSFQVFTATGFDEATEIFEEAKPEVVLLDIDLGESRSGVDLLHRLREMPGASDLPAVACTAYAVRGSRLRFLSAGFTEYLGKPFTRDQLVETIEDALNRGRTDTASTHRDRIELNVPPPPSTFPEIVRLLARKDVEPDTPKLIDVIQQDPLTLFWVLRHLNSAYYALRRPVSELERAVAMLGYDPICNLILTELVTQTFATMDSEEAQDVHQHLFTISLATGAIARKLGYLLEVDRPELAFSAGLLHQLGRMAMLSSCVEKYVRLWRRSSEDGSRMITPDLDCETAAYGEDYPRIGAEIAREWQLPDEIITIIRYHRDVRWVSSRRLRQMALLVHVGHCEALRLFESPPANVALARLQKMQDAVRDLAEDVGMTSKSVMQALPACEKEARSLVEAVTSDREQRSLSESSEAA